MRKTRIIKTKFCLSHDVLIFHLLQFVQAGHQNIKHFSSPVNRSYKLGSLQSVIVFKCVFLGTGTIICTLFGKGLYSDQSALKYLAILTPTIYNFNSRRVLMVREIDI